MRIASVEKALLALIILGIITGMKVLGGAINLRIYTFVVLVVFLVRIDRMGPIISGNGKFWLPTFLFVGSCGFSAFEVINHDMFMKQLVLLCTFLLIPLAMVALVNKRSGNLDGTLTWLVLGGMVANVNGYLDPFYRFKSMGWAGAYGRPQSFFTEANEYGQFMVLLWGYLLAMLVLPGLSRRIRTWGILSSALMFPVFMINNSRGSYLGLAVQGLVATVILFLTASRRTFVKVMASGALALALLLGGSYWFATLVPVAPGWTLADFLIQRTLAVKSTDDPTVSLRSYQQAQGYQAFLDNPLTGTGLGNIMYYLNERTELDETGILRGPIATTSFWLTDLLGETGLLGTVSMILAMLALLAQAWRNFRWFGSSAEGVLSVGNFMSILGMLVNGVSYPPIYLTFFWLNVGVTLQLTHVRVSGQVPAWPSRAAETRAAASIT